MSDRAAEGLLVASAVAIFAGLAAVAWLLLSGLGLLLLGLVTLLVAVQVDLEGGIPIGHPQTTDLYARTRAAMTDPGEREERRTTRRRLAYARVAGGVAATTGLLLVAMQWFGGR